MQQDGLEVVCSPSVVFRQSQALIFESEALEFGQLPLLEHQAEVTSVVDIHVCEDKDHAQPVPMRLACLQNAKAALTASLMWRRKVEELRSNGCWALHQLLPRYYRSAAKSTRCF